MKVCLDTNVLVAAFATRGLCADILRTVLAEHELIIGDVIVAEFQRTLARKLKVPPDRIEAAVGALTTFPLIARPEEAPSVAIRDPSDRWILATALAGGAEVLVTGDRDLLEVRDNAPLPIVEPRAFWELLRAAARDEP